MSLYYTDIANMFPNIDLESLTIDGRDLHVRCLLRSILGRYNWARIPCMPLLSSLWYIIQPDSEQRLFDWHIGYIRSSLAGGQHHEQIEASLNYLAARSV